MSTGVNIQSLRQTSDTARKYKWDVIFNFPGGGGNERHGQNVRCLSADQPKPTVQVIDVEIRSFTKKEAGAVSWDPITLTFIETENYELVDLFWRWLNDNEYNVETGKQKKKVGGYEGQDSGITLNLLKLDDSVGGHWTLYGCVLESCDFPTMDNSKDGIWDDLTATIHYDYALWQRGGASGNTETAQQKDDRVTQPTPKQSDAAHRPS